MEATTISELVSLPNGILILLLVFGAYVMKQLRQDGITREDKLEAMRAEEKQLAIRREDKLTEHIDKQANSLENINLSMQKMNENLEENTQAIGKLSENYNSLHSRVDTIENKI